MDNARHLPVLAVAGAIVAAALLTDMAAQDASAEQQTTTFTHQACPDCLVMRVNYFPPKP